MDSCIITLSDFQVDDESDLAGVPLQVVESEGPQKKELTSIDSNVEVLHGQPLVQYDGDPLDVDGSPLEGDEMQDDPADTTQQ